MEQISYLFSHKYRTDQVFKLSFSFKKRQTGSHSYTVGGDNTSLTLVLKPKK